MNAQDELTATLKYMQVEIAAKSDITLHPEAAAQVCDHIDSLHATLLRMVFAHRDLQSDTEGQYPLPDTGCIECTAGTVPDRLNTGRCAYHEAVNLLDLNRPGFQRAAHG